MSEYDTPPDGFDLEREKSREQAAARGGIVARDAIAEPDFPTAAGDGSAAENDDDAVDAPHDPDPVEEV